MILVWNDKEYKLNYAKFKSRSARLGKSEIHLECRDLLNQMLMGYGIYEEVTLPGCNLYADFFIPGLRLVVEVHGRQHYEYVNFFHKTKANFLMSKKRDKTKAEFCMVNDLSLAILPYNEKEKWNQIIVQSMESQI